VKASTGAVILAPSGVKPMPWARVVLSDAVKHGLFVQYDPNHDMEMTITPIQYKTVGNEIHHTGTSAHGSCGGVLLTEDMLLLGIHYHGSTGDKRFPNAGMLLPIAKNA